MASYYQNKRTKKWGVRFRLQGKQKHLSGFNAKREAENAYMLYPKEHTQENSRIKFKDLYAEFLEYKNKNVKESTLYEYINCFKNHLTVFYDKAVNLITKKDILVWHSYLEKKGYKYKTKNKLQFMLVSVLNYAKKFHGIKDNVAADVGGFKNSEIRKEMQFWTEQEFKIFIESIDNITYKTFFTFLFYMGARKGEAQALQWQDIDFERQECKIYKTYTRKITDKSIYKITSTKTKGSVRNNLIPSFLLTQLKELKQWCLNIDPETNKESFVFGINKPLCETTITRIKNEACAKTGVKQIRIHDLRHSHATQILNGSNNIYLVAKRLGHSDVNITLSVYGHLLPNAERELIDKIG